MNYTNQYTSHLGLITMASDGQTLTGLWFAGQKYFGAGLVKETKVELLPVFEETGKWLDIYFEGREPEFMPPIQLEGTPFQKQVWNILKTIPYGQTITYKEIAKKLVKERGLIRMSAQAVGGAVGRNPVSLIVPCHRVVGANGSLTGYAGGIEKKEWLIRLEQGLL